MLRFLRRRLRQFFRKTRLVKNEPLNRASLVVIILIDIFILINVFTGIDDIGRWHLAPSEAYPCYSDWRSYRESTVAGKDYDFLRSTVSDAPRPVPYQEDYETIATDRLGEVSPVCLDYASRSDAANNKENRQFIALIDQKQAQVAQQQEANRQIRAQYDSTLLEEIAGQPRDQSINAVEASQARQEIAQNDQAIATLQQEIATLKTQMVEQVDSANLLILLKNDVQFQTLEQGYQRADFWYPTIQLSLQALFLLPLIALALGVHSLAYRRRYDLVALISWHLLIIFLIPLIVQVFQFFQVGALFDIVFDVVTALFGSLLFLVSYLYILLIPLLGFGIIKVFQRFVLNPKVQAASRVQKSLCIRCAKKLQPDDIHCPHCGYDQYAECHTCHHGTYKHLPYCRHCGAEQG